MKVNKLTVAAWATGVKNRCRKVDKHLFQLGTHDVDSSREALADMAAERIKQGMKSVSTAYLNVTPCEVDEEFGYVTVLLSRLGGNGDRIDLMPRLS